VGLVVTAGPPSGWRIVGFGLPGLDVLLFAALREWPAAAEQHREVVVEVVAEPGGDAGAWLQAERLPGVP